MDTLRYMQALTQDRPILSFSTALILGAGIIAYLDYRAYVALGPHGLPNTFWGWHKQLLMCLKSRKDTTIPAPYDLGSVAGPHDREMFLPKTAAGGLSWRLGNKAPHVPGFVAPQRQTTDVASGKTKKAMFSYLDALVVANLGALQTQTSVLEGPVPAMGMKDFQSMPEASRPQVLTHTRGEMCHIHPPDGSTHLLLSLADQKKVIELGWGRRHRLSGGGLLPWNYTFIYAPRDEEEMAAWRSIVVAGARFCCVDVAEIQVPATGSVGMLE